MPFAVDTNVLVYRYDPRFPEKQRIAETLLRDGVASGDLRVPHQALVEFVAATTRTRTGPLLTQIEALREVEEWLTIADVLAADPAVLRLAVRGAATYQLSWFDAHLWAFAERWSVPLLYSEDFEHGRVYGAVRVVNPFRDA